MYTRLKILLDQKIITQMILTKYIKIKFISGDNLPPTKTWELYDVIIVVISVFSDSNKCYLQVFLDECFSKLAW